MTEALKAQPVRSTWIQYFSTKASDLRNSRFCVSISKNASAAANKAHHFFVATVLPALKGMKDSAVAHGKKWINFVSTHREKALFFAIGAGVGVAATFAFQHLFFSQTNTSVCAKAAAKSTAEGDASAPKSPTAADDSALLSKSARSAQPHDTAEQKGTG